MSPGVYEVPETAGTARGDNLFHSFGDFDIGVGDRATFTAEAEYERVIARVTGGEPSKIDGTLASTVMADAAEGTGADLYLLNPWGLLFGPSSSIDVPAGLHLSTAQQLHFADGVVLDVTNETAPVLSIDDPVAFGFLGGPPPNPDLEYDIEFGNPLTPNFVGTRPGQTFSIVGRDVRVLNRMFLTAQSGTLQIAALGEAAAQVPLDVADLETRSGNPEQLGSVELSGRGQLTTLAFDADADQGRIVIRAGRFAVAGAAVQAGGGGADGFAVDIETAGAVSVGANSTIATVNQGAQDAGSVHIRAGSLSLDGTNAVIRSQVAGNGAAGDLDVDAGSIHLRNGAQIEARSDSLSGPVSGAVGDINLVAANEIRVESGADVVSRTHTLGAGGDISIEAARLSVLDGALSAESGLAAAGGSIAIDAEQVEVRGGLSQINTLNRVTAAPEPTIPGGAIRIGSAGDTARSVIVADGGVISTETSGAQPGGEIRVFANALEVTGSGLDEQDDARSSALQTSTVSSAETGVGGAIFLEVGSLRVGTSEPGGVPGIVAAFVAAGARAPGGSIDIVGDSALLEDGGQISTTTQGVGHAGSIHIDLTSDFVARGSHVGDALEPSGVFARGAAGSSGDAGDIHIEGRSIEVLDAAEISSRGLGSGVSGSITLEAREAIRIVGGFQASNVTARGAVGGAGDLLLSAPTITLLDGGTADVSVTGGSNGGVLRVRGGDLRISGRSHTGIPSSLAAETAGEGRAQGIDVDVTGHVRVEGGAQINSFARSLGLPGDITVHAETIEFTGARTTGTAESVPGALVGGGSIHLDAARWIRVRDGADVTVRSAEGQDAGMISLVAPRVDLSDASLTADAAGFGGNVEITSDFLFLEKSSIVAHSLGGSEGPGALAVAPSGVDTPAGGNITIDGGAVILNEAILDANGFGNANGGFVDITADPWLRSGDSAITASSEFGLDGFVLVNTPYGEVTGDLAALPETFLDASSLLEEPCLARDAPSGSFAVQRAPRVAPPPDAPLSGEPAEPQQCDAPPAP